MLTSVNNSYLTVIGVYEMHGRMHDNYFVGIVDPLGYFMMTHPLPMALQKLWLLGNYQQAVLLATQYDDEIISIKISVICTLYIIFCVCTTFVLYFLFPRECSLQCQHYLLVSQWSICCSGRPQRVSWLHLYCKVALLCATCVCASQAVVT